MTTRVFPFHSWQMEFELGEQADHIIKLEEDKHALERQLAAATEVTEVPAVL